ncbi:MAG: hypothetical protein GF334_04885 [Candidatus Altiarchaeales archaeon]|nr:hypothetical protein [Candidatus Altiarchaeales archaeon]
METRKGTYRQVVESEDGSSYVSEKGFTFEEAEGKELAFDVHEHETGMAMLFGDQIFFLGFWTDEQLEKASNTFNEAIKKEIERRKRDATS